MVTPHPNPSAYIDNPPIIQLQYYQIYSPALNLTLQGSECEVQCWLPNLQNHTNRNLPYVRLFLEILFSDRLVPVWFLICASTEMH